MLNICGENGFEHVSVDVRNIDHLFCLASDILKCKEELSLFLFVDRTLIDDKEYLKTLTSGTELISCKPDQKQKLLIHFDVKRYCAAQKCL